MSSLLFGLMLMKRGFVLWWKAKVRLSAAKLCRVVFPQEARAAAGPEINLLSYTLHNPADILVFFFSTWSHPTFSLSLVCFFFAPFEIPRSVVPPRSPHQLAQFVLRGEGENSVGVREEGIVGGFLVR